MMNTTQRTGPLTEEEIHNAADAIVARGKEATQKAVRAECGNRGSMATISKHLSIWRHEHEATNARISRELTPELKRETLSLMAKVAERFSEEAEIKCRQLETAHRIESDRNRVLLDQACQEADDCVAELSQERAMNDQLQTENKALKQDARDLFATLEDATGQIRILKTEISFLKPKGEQDKIQIKGLQERFDNAQLEKGRLKGIESTQKKQIAELRAELAAKSLT